MAEYDPDREDIVWLHFTPQVGHEQAGRRPVVREATAKILALVDPD